MSHDYLQLIEKADVYGAAVKTPLARADKLSANMGNDVYIKREDLQPVFSFKIRGAYNKMQSLTAEELQRGVIAASAGNHAQGVALSASLLGIKATIVMPETSPEIKIDAVKNYGAEVILHGENYADAAEKAALIMADSKATYIHPYDDPHVIAGQGTIGKEIIQQSLALLNQTPDIIFICVGGGGLAAGIATYIKQTRPHITLIGVQPVDSDAMRQSLQAQKKVRLEKVDIFADGVAVKEVGDETFRLCQQYLDDVLVVTTDEICAAIKDAFEDTRSILEPAGALAIAGAKKYARDRQIKGQTIVVTASGANTNFDRLRHVCERTEFAERREAIIAITLPESPGVIKEFCELIGNRSITEFNYRFRDPNEAVLYVGLQIKDQNDLDQVIQTLLNRGYAAIDLTDNELAKLHLRHMIGGNHPLNTRERIFRFRFPEKPGALMSFLNHAGNTWNISLFHYRNHGADFGRVLCAFEVPEEQETQFNAFISQLDYWLIDESKNPAYRLFLCANEKS